MKINNKINSANSVALFLVVFITALLIKVFAVFIFQMNSVDGNSDVAGYMKCAEELLLNGKVSTLNEWVFNFPYLLWYSAFISLPMHLFGASYTVVSVYLAVISSISLALLFSTLSYSFGNFKGLGVSILLIFLPSQILLPQCIIHEHALFFFLSIGLFLYFRVLPVVKTKKIKIVVFISFSLAVMCAMLVNGAGIIALIAFVIYFLIKNKGILTRIFFPIILIVIVLLGSGTINKLSINFINIDAASTEKMDSSTWAYYVGLNTDYNGGFSPKDSEAYGWDKTNFNKTGLTGEALEEYRKGLLSDRLNEMLANPKALIELECQKFKTIWEKYDYPYQFYDTSKVNAQVDIAFRFFINIEYFIYFLLALAALLNSIFNFKNEVNDSSVLLWSKLFMLGMTAALLLIECNNKYTFLLQILFISYCVCSVDARSFYHRFMRRRI